MTRFIASASLRAIVVLFVAGASFPTLAHVPHDVVNAVEISPAYSRDRMVFASVRENLLRSRDGGFTWRRLTLGLGRVAFTDLDASPSFEADSTLFLATWDGGIYRSQDGGLFWEQRNRGLSDLRIALVEVSEGFASDRSALAATFLGDLYLTEDSGESWKRIMQEPPVTLNPPNEEVGWSEGFLRARGITSLRFAKEAIVVGTARGEIRISRDRGVTWASLRLPTPQRITSIEVPEGSSDGLLFVGTELDGVVRVLDWGASFEFAGGAASGEHITSLTSAKDAEGRLILFASAWDDGVLRSLDVGRTWTKQAEGLTRDRQADDLRYGHPHFRGIAASDGYSSDSTLFVGGFDGLFKSSDGGESWRQLETLPFGGVVGLDLSPMTDSGFAVALSTYVAGVYTRNAGKDSWEIDKNANVLKPRLSAIGYSPDYSEDGLLFVTGIGNTIARRSLADPLWIMSRVPRKFTDEVYRAALLRFRSIHSWFSSSPLLDFSDYYWNIRPSLIEFSPDFREDRTLFVGTFMHGLFRSVDGGSSFSLVLEGAERSLYSVAVSPEFGADGTAFASTLEGIFQSRDRGVSWKKLRSIGELGKPVLAVSPAYGADRTVFAGGRGGLFRSRDGGETWERLVLAGAGSEGEVDGIALSPAFGEEPHMLVRTTGRGLLRSRDGGETFERIGDGGSDYSYTFSAMSGLADREMDSLIKYSPDYRSDRTIYASSVLHLLKSTDGGSSWESVPRPVRYDTAVLGWDRWTSAYATKGLWRILEGSQFTRGMTSWADWPGDETQFTFVGTGVRWIGARGPDHGMADVLIDGVHRARVDQYSEMGESGVLSFSETGLGWGPHVLTITIADARNERSSAPRIEIDAFDVLGYR